MCVICFLKKKQTLWSRSFWSNSADHVLVSANACFGYQTANAGCAAGANTRSTCRPRVEHAAKSDCVKPIFASSSEETCFPSTSHHQCWIRNGTNPALPMLNSALTAVTTVCFFCASLMVYAWNENKKKKKKTFSRSHSQMLEVIRKPYLAEDDGYSCANGHTVLVEFVVQQQRQSQWRLFASRLSINDQVADDAFGRNADGG